MTRAFFTAGGIPENPSSVWGRRASTTITTVVPVRDDPEVVAALVAGDPHALETAYQAYADRLYAFCRGLLQRPGEAADAVHDTFVLAASGRSSCKTLSGCGRDCMRWRGPSACGCCGPTSAPAGRGTGPCDSS